MAKTRLLIIVFAKANTNENTTLLGDSPKDEICHWMEISFWFFSKYFLITSLHLANSGVSFQSWPLPPQVGLVLPTSTELWVCLYVSVCLGCYNKLPQTEWLKQWTLISHGSGGWSPRSGCRQIQSAEGPLPISRRFLTATEKAKPSGLFLQRQ